MYIVYTVPQAYTKQKSSINQKGFYGLAFHQIFSEAMVIVDKTIYVLPDTSVVSNKMT